MKKSLLVSIVLFALALSGRTQSFEGTLTYTVEFELEGEFLNLKDQIFEKMRNEGSYFDTLRVYLKEGKYTKTDNSLNQKTTIYLPDENKIYTLEKGSEFVPIIDAGKVASIDLGFPEPDMHMVDSIKFVNGIPCDILKLSWGNLGEEWYFFNKQTAVIAPELFTSHNYEYLNRVLSKTGSYPLEMVRSMNNLLSIRMSLISIEEGELSEDLFRLPELKKANKKMRKMVKDLTGTEIMEIKN